MMKPLFPVLAVSVLLMAGCSSRVPATAPATAAHVAVARGRIDVEGGVLSLASTREGTVVRVAVHEGDTVRKGQALAMLDAQPARLQLQAAEAALAQAVAQRELLDGKLAAARKQARRLTEAAREGAGDGQSADAASAEARAASAERDAAAAAVAMAVQKRDEARYELAQHTLVSPVDASVERVAARAGLAVAPASGPLFVLLPHAPMIVNAELNETFADAVTPGMPAEVVRDGEGPSQRWHAHVLRVGRMIGAAQFDDDAPHAGQHAIACVLAFDAVPGVDARVGQRVLVEFGTAATGSRKPAEKTGPYAVGSVSGTTP